MRAIFDTNIFINYLLPSSKSGIISTIIEAAFEGRFTLLLPTELVEEFSSIVGTKRYLAQKISPKDAARLISLLTQVAEVIAPISARIPAATRHVKDDYLLAYALTAQADYLVTGDDDLLVLDQVEGVKVVAPVEFLEVLQANPRP